MGAFFSHNRLKFLQTIVFAAIFAFPLHFAHAQDVSTGLVGHWRLDETTGTSAIDSSVSGNDGTMSGLNATNDWVKGKLKTALDFGGNDYINIGTSAIDGATEASVCTWYHYEGVDPIPETKYLVSKYQPGFHGWTFVLSSGTQSIHFNPGSNTGGTGLNSSPSSIKFNEWTHVCGVFKANEYIRIYIDGELDTERTTSIHTSVSSSGPNLRIGAHQFGGNRFDGPLDDVRLYTRALTAQDVKALATTFPEPLSCNAAYEAVMMYNYVEDVMQYCDGTDWIQTGKAPHSLSAGGVCSANQDGPYTQEGKTMDPGGSALGIWAAGGFIFVANGWEAGGTPFYVYTFDGTDFSLVDSELGGHSYPEAIWSDGTYYYVGSPGAGLYAYGFDGSSLTMIDADTTNVTQARQMWGDGTYIYVANGSGGFRAMTFNGTTLATAGSALSSNGFSMGAYSDGTYVFLADGGGGVRMYTFDGTNWTSIDSDTTKNTQRIWGDGTYIYGANADGVTAYSYNATTLTPITTFTTTGGNGRGVWGDGTNIYLADSANGFYALRFDGTTFTELDNIPSTAQALAVSGEGDYVFLADQNNGIKAISSFTCSACLSPDGVAGEVDYNLAKGVMQYCNGANWIAMGPESADGGSDPDDLSPLAPTFGLVGHWTLDETGGTTTAIDSAGSNNGTMFGSLSGADTTNGKIASALLLDGGGYITVPDTTDVEPALLTVSTWVKATTVPQVAYTGIISKRWANAEPYTSYHIAADNTGGAYYFCTGDGTPASRTCTSAATATTNWMHLVGVYDGTNIHLYTDGVLFDSQPFAGPIGYSAENLYIGITEPAASSQDFNGAIDDVRIYNRALSTNEITDLYKASSQKLHLKLDEVTGTTAADSSSYANTSTMFGGLDGGANNVTGQVNSAIDFDGSDDRISTPTNASLNDSGQLTYAGWFYPTSLTTNRRLFENGVNILSTSTSDNLYFNAGRWSGGYAAWNTDASSLTLNQWNHIAITYDYSSTANDPVIYINGSAANLTETVAPSGTVSATNYGLHIGNRSGGDRPWSGYIDDFRLYNRTLSATEVAFLHESTGGTAPAGGPTGCPNPGDVCGDGSVNAGVSTDGGITMYTTPADAPGTYTWNDGSSNWANVVSPQCSGTSVPGLSSATCDTGAANTAVLIGLSGGGTPAPYAAAEYCEALTVHGQSDWYLPALNELNQMYVNRVAIDGFDLTASGIYYSSSEAATNVARFLRFSNGTSGTVGKNQLWKVRCARKGNGTVVLDCASPQGATGTMIYNDDFNVMQFCNGSEWIEMQ